MESVISLMYLGLSLYHALNNELIVTLCYVGMAATYLAAYYARKREKLGPAPEHAAPS